MQTSGQYSEIKVDKLNISYQDEGQGDTPVIFIHGFPFNKSSWAPQMEFLKISHRVIAYDIRGFSNSSSEDMKASIDIFAKDLIALMDALHIRQAILCGISMGGYIALNAIQHYPDRFKGLILSNTQAVADTDEGKEKRYKTIEQVENNGLQEFADGFVEKLFSPSTHQNKTDVVDEIRETILSTPVPTIARTLSALAQRLETTSILQDIKVPTLIISGTDDTVIPTAQSESMHERIPGSEFHLIPGAGHLPNLEQPDVFNQHVKEFLDRVNS